MGVSMRETEELHLVGHAEVAPHLRGPGRWHAHGRAPDDARQRRRPRRRARRAARRMGRVDEPHGPRRRARARRTATHRLPCSGAAAATTSSRECRSATKARATRSSRAACSRPRSSCPRTDRRSGAARSCSTPLAGLVGATTAADTRMARRPSGRRRRGRDRSRAPSSATRGASSTAVSSRRSSISRPSTRPDGGCTTDVVLHFLAPNRVGPVRASARVLGRRADGQRPAHRGPRRRREPHDRARDRHRRRAGVTPWRHADGRGLRLGELHRKVLDRRDERVGAAFGLGAFGDVDVGQAGEQLVEQDPDLGAGEVRAEAEMRARTEREVQVRRTVDVEARRGRRTCRRRGSRSGTR